MNYEQTKAWGILLRLYHWLLMLSIIGLVITGFYINTPWTNTTLEGSVSFPMANMRYYHFLSGYLFTAVILIRIFLFFFGNRQERIWELLPITPRNIKNLYTTVLYYSYMAEKDEERPGHNAIAGITYVLTIALALIQLLSGFYLLYPESTTWQQIGNTLFHSQQNGRVVHHLLMWYFIIFAFVHVYLVIWNELKSSEGLISALINGNKFKHKNV